MIDTVRVQWGGIRFGEDTQEWLLQEYETPDFHTRFYDPGLPWQGATVQDKSLGTIGIKSNKQGTYLWAERSLPKFLYGDNCRVLSATEAKEAVDLWLGGVEARFGQWFDGTLPVSIRREVRRVDLCFQQQVPCSGEIFAHLARCFKERKLALHMGGIEIHKSKWEHIRFYDKGLESGNEQYADVVRHEEQLRGPWAQRLLSVTGYEGAYLNVQEAREKMNGRYAGWEPMQGYDMRSLLKRGVAGAVAALLVRCPEYDALAKEALSNGTYYNARTMKAEAERSAFPLDLRLPDDAWAEPMVL